MEFTTAFRSENGHKFNGKSRPIIIVYSHRVDVKDLCQVKEPTGEESRFQLAHEPPYAPGQRNLGILSSDKVAVLLQVSLLSLKMLKLLHLALLRVSEKIPFLRIQIFQQIARRCFTAIEEMMS